MLASAKRLYDRLALDTARPDPLVMPSRGTGPCGAPSDSEGANARWITSRDVISANHRSTAYCPKSWDAQQASLPSASDRIATSTVQLRDYQERAVNAAHPAPHLFLSGIDETGCGLGKTIIAGELIRQTRAPAVVVVLHTMSQTQFVQHLTERVGLERVLTPGDAWTFDQPLPDAVVMTYQALVSSSKAVEKHADRQSESDSGSDLIWMLHAERFGILILDEVHMALADQFQRAMQLHASVVYGMTGSLIREDDRIESLHTLVGPILSTYHSNRLHKYEIITVPLHEDTRKHIEHARPRSKEETALRAVNPYKYAALLRVLHRESGKQVIVFCDSARAACVLSQCLPAAFYLHGGTPESRRESVKHRFNDAVGGAVLITTEVSDASVDFKDGSVIVQYHIIHGSRQVEAQRSGRGSRSDGVSGSHVIHIRNESTEEVSFVDWRVAYMKERFKEAFRCAYYNWNETPTDPQAFEPMRKLFSIKLTLPSTSSGGRPHQNGSHHTLKTLLARKRKAP